ncbi:BolA/IbaG family iron-sulfur metabolism protein [Anaplasma phagocytophilum]|uniref:BolA-like family protein n=3 Tax=Anaplasma phagocytophilum TaxID=948 RepID=A0A0F3NLM1_ANAPH|nr:BolA/IbaG family iron-sulfur metabolism protein [Anaplasma phagocytophilum]KJV68582.1 bolA-like family protein [Anaplasma phagocytophilum str. NCH-1]KJZ99849.1 bolA-like family protein [Anaplasma phagocytophilum]
MLYIWSLLGALVMAVDLLKLRELLCNSFPDGIVDVTSLADDNDHYSVRIVSKRFAGKSKLEQHRMVYDALSGVVVHALQIQTSVGSKQDG